MNNTNKNYPSHKVWFSDSETKPNANHGVAAGVVWPRKSKQGGILKWNISPEILGAGVWRLLGNFLRGQPQENLPVKTYSISFSQTLDGTSKLGRAIKVASVDEDGIIYWSIVPDKLTDGVLFVLEERTPETQSAALKRPACRSNASNESRN